MTLSILIGGPADGQFVEVDYRRIRWEIITPGDGDERHHYAFKKIGCPDHWTEVVFVHPSVDIGAFTESDFISIVMKLWRETHRRKAVAVESSAGQQWWTECYPQWQGNS